MGLILPSSNDELQITSDTRKEARQREMPRRSVSSGPFDTVCVPTYAVFMNITLSIDEGTVRRARRAARAQGKSLNQLVREYLQTLSASADPAAEIEELRNLSRRSKGRSRGWRFNRDEIHERA
jgi:hypothetical protein